MSNSTRENLDLTQCSHLQLIELAFFNITQCSVLTNRVGFFSAKLSAQWQLIKWVSTLFVCVPTVDCI